MAMHYLRGDADGHHRRPARGKTHCFTGGPGNDKDTGGSGTARQRICSSCWDKLYAKRAIDTIYGSKG